MTLPLFSTPTSSLNIVSESSRSRSSTPIVNPLVMAGLLPSNLSDILAVANPEVQPKRRVVKARVVTDEEHYAILKSKEKKEQEDKEAKEKRRLEREKKKEERERLKEAKGREREKRSKKRKHKKKQRSKKRKHKKKQRSKRNPAGRNGSDHLYHQVTRMRSWSQIQVHQGSNLNICVVFKLGL